MHGYCCCDQIHENDSACYKSVLVFQPKKPIPNCWKLVQDLVPPSLIMGTPSYFPNSRKDLKSSSVLSTQIQLCALTQEGTLKSKSLNNNVQNQLVS